MITIVQNESGVILELKEKLPYFIPNINKLFVRPQFPDLLVRFDNGRVASYEIEYRLSNFFQHGHYGDERNCDGIVYWIDDRDEANLSESALCDYELICIGDDKEHDIGWANEYETNNTKPDRAYSVTYVAKELGIDNKTVKKLLDIIPDDLYFRLPINNFIRIKGEAIRLIKENLI